MKIFSAKRGNYSILILRPHHVAVNDVIRAVSAIKNQFPNARVAFSGNKENLTSGDLSALQASGTISKFLIYDAKEMSRLSYVRMLRKERFDDVVFLSLWGDYYQPLLNRKSEALFLLIGAKRLLEYDLTGSKFLGSDIKPWVRKIRILMPDFFALVIGFMLLPLTILAVAVLLYNQLKNFGNRVPAKTASGNIYMWKKLHGQKKDDTLEMP